MKKITLLAIVVCIVSAAQAQIGKGSLMLGGALNFGISSDNSGTPIASYSNNRAIISPVGGLAFKENLIAGIGLTYGNSKYQNTSNPNTSQSARFKTTGGFFFIRKYRILGKGFYLFGEPNINYTVNDDIRNFDVGNGLVKQSDKYQSLGLSLYPGIAYAVNKKIHLEIGMNKIFSLGYNKRTYSQLYLNGDVIQSQSTGFDLSTNLSTNAPFTVGARFVLAK